MINSKNCITYVPHNIFKPIYCFIFAIIYCMKYIESLYIHTLSLSCESICMIVYFLHCLLNIVGWKLSFRSNYFWFQNLVPWCGLKRIHQQLVKFVLWLSQQLLHIIITIVLFKLFTISISKFQLTIHVGNYRKLF